MGDILVAAARREAVIAIVSAFQGVTNQLIDCARRAEQADASHVRILEQLARRHRAAVANLIGEGKTRARVQVDALIDELASTLQGIHLLRHCPPRALDVTASFGERLSAVIVAAYLNRRHPAVYVDAREFVVTDDQFTNAAVNFRRTYPRSRRVLAAASRGGRVIPVVTGFIGATKDGQTTT